MKLIIPNNIFATLFLLTIDKRLKPDTVVKESSLISKELEKSEDSIALLPSFDLINYRELFVSSKFGLGFDGLLSNSYIYFGEGGREVSKVFLRGDISTNDAILSKIVFQERYNILPEFSLDTEDMSSGNNYIICGNENWLNENYKKGNSFSEQIFDLIEFPYINYVLVSRNEELLSNFHNSTEVITEDIRLNLEENLNKIGFDSTINDFIKNELDSVYFDFSEDENTALKELLQFVYYHKILDDLFDVKFVK